MQLEDYRLKGCPATIFYVPDFINKDEEEFLLQQVYNAPKPKWTQLSNRRLQNWGGLPHPKGMIAEKLPMWLEKCTRKVASLGVFKEKIPNHVLVNEYESGQGIMPHEDGPLFYPVISTINLGSHTLLDFYRHSTDTGVPNVDQNNPFESGLKEDISFEKRYVASLLLEPRSLLILKDSMYTDYLHGIKECQQDSLRTVWNLESCPEQSFDSVMQRTRRISLTIRHVPKVLKNKLLFGSR